MKSINKYAAQIAISSLLFSGAALANPPKPNVFDGGNRWHITFYNDSTSTHQQWATQEICFLPYNVVGTSIQGVWYATSFPDWNGRYYQEGDEVKMTGDYARDVGHDHMTLIHTTYGGKGSLAFKDWTEWREDRKYGRIIGWGNARLKRVGYCRVPRGIDQPARASALRRLENQAQTISSALPERLTVDGEVATSPGDSKLESIEAYQRRIKEYQFSSVR